MGTENEGLMSRKKKPVPFLRSKAWKELREKALERDGRRCVLCGSDQNLNVHHIFPRKFHKDLQEDIENVAVVCAKCHFRIHKDAGYIQLAVFLMENCPDQWKWIKGRLRPSAPDSAERHFEEYPTGRQHDAQHHPEEAEHCAPVP